MEPFQFSLNRLFITNSLHENLLALMFVLRAKIVKYLDSYSMETYSEETF